VYSIGPILLELFFVLLKPQEIWEFLTKLQPLYTLPGLIVLGFVIDSGRYALGVTRMKAAPYLEYAVVFLGWTMVTVLVNAAGELVPNAIQFGTAMLMALGIAHSVQTLGLYRLLAAALLSLTLFLAFVGAHQAFQPTRCFVLDPNSVAALIYDGRPCPGPFESIACYRDEDIGEDVRYVCERPGLMSTASITGRVRFRGNLEDPNELALTVSAGLPFAFGFYKQKKDFLRGLLLLVALVLVAMCVFFSQSRGGQLVLMTVLGTLFVHRFGWKWAVTVGSLALPGLAVVASMGGRSAEEAEGSALERTELLQHGLESVVLRPLFGLGKGQFPNHFMLTAHNSYVLAASETGLFGYCVWLFVMVLMIKIPISILREMKEKDTPKAKELTIWATSALASGLGVMLGSFFLSFTFHPILWIYIGVAGALYGTVRRLDPTFRVGLSRNQKLAVCAGGIALLTMIRIYVRIKLGA
jgi:hypothetical protein